MSVTLAIETRLDIFCPRLPATPPHLRRWSVYWTLGIPVAQIMCFRNSMKKRDVGIQNDHHPSSQVLWVDKDKSSIVKSQETTEAFIWYVDTKRKNSNKETNYRAKNIAAFDETSNWEGGINFMVLRM